MLIRRTIEWIVALALLALSGYLILTQNMHQFLGAYNSEVGRALLPIDRALAMLVGLLGIASLVLAAKFNHLLFKWAWWLGVGLICAAFYLTHLYENYLSGFLMDGAGG